MAPDLTALMERLGQYDRLMDLNTLKAAIGSLIRHQNTCNMLLYRLTNEASELEKRIKQAERRQ